MGLGKPWQWPAGEGHVTAVGRSSVDKGCWLTRATHQILVDEGGVGRAEVVNGGFPAAGYFLPRAWG